MFSLEEIKNFPSISLLPKEEIGALEFLKNYPDFDGKEIKVAILDSGVDLGAPGLKVLSDGKVKIIDCIDCTGSGDVDISSIVKLEENNIIQGLTGRKLRIGNWNNPSENIILELKNFSNYFLLI
jgi:tripeptidyl-peptidase-2